MLAHSFLGASLSKCLIALPVYCDIRNALVLRTASDHDAVKCYLSDGVNDTTV